MTADPHDDHDDTHRRSNLLPAVVIAVAALVGGQMAASGGKDSPATAEGAAGPGSTAAAASEAPPITEPAPTTTIDLGPAWSYRADDSGPPHWGALEHDWALCESGTEQSPIEIEGAVAGSLDLGFVYATTDGTITFDARLLQIALEPGSGITIGGVFYDLERAELHTPSEHVVASEGFPAELQLYHRAADGSEVAVAVMIAEGEANPLLDPIFKGAEAQAMVTEPLYGPLELADLLPADRSVARYEGSHTTPPCAEGLTWYVLTTPVTASPAQIEQAAEVTSDGSARPLQPVNDRVLTIEAAAAATGDGDGATG